MPTYVERLVDPLLAEVLAEHPAVLLTGPRACGKTTSAVRHARTTVRLDVPAEAAAFEADPDAAMRRITEYPLLLDEWQEVPGVLGAVKRLVDAERRPGRFILSGSVRAPLDGRTWPGTGRLIAVPMTTLCMRERAARRSASPFLARLARGEGPEPIPDAPDLVDYVDLALEGGFPEPVTSLSPSGKSRWYEGYVEQLLGRDMIAFRSDAGPPRLKPYLQAYALNSAGVSDHSTVFTAAGITRKTAERYEALLQSLYLVDALPAWSSNRLRRLAVRPKRVVVDTGLWASLVDVDRDGVLRDGGLLGRLLETFVIVQLRAELPLTPRIRLHHLRAERGRREVDIIAEIGAGRVIGIEVKATAAPRVGDAKHLAWLRDALGDQFARGVVLHTGPSAFRLGDRIDAVPICALWG